MLDKKDYSKSKLEELLQKEKAIKKKDTFSSAIIGFLVGVMIYGVANNGFSFLYIFIPLLLIIGIYKNLQKIKNELEQIRAEINAKNAK